MVGWGSLTSYPSYTSAMIHVHDRSNFIVFCGFSTESTLTLKETKFERVAIAIANSSNPLKQPINLSYIFTDVEVNDTHAVVSGLLGCYMHDLF